MFTSLLTQRAWIKKPRGLVDRLGQPADEWDDKAINVPCRLQSGSGRPGVEGGERRSLEQRGWVSTYFVVYMDVGVDVNEGDRIVEIREPNGRVAARDLDIVLVRKVCDGNGLPSHLEVRCREVRSTADA